MRNRAIITGWKRAAIAAAVAYALVLQVLLLSLSGALHATAATGPQAFICAQGTQTDSAPSPSRAHDSLCCLLSCHGAGPAGPLPVLASVQYSAPVAAILRAAGQALARGPDSNVLPVGSRAPPRLG